MTSYRKRQTPIKLGVKRKYSTRKSIITAKFFLAKRLHKGTEKTSYDQSSNYQ